MTAQVNSTKKLQLSDIITLPSDNKPIHENTAEKRSKIRESAKNFFEKNGKG